MCKYKDRTLGCDMELPFFIFFHLHEWTDAFIPSFECCSSLKVSVAIYYDNDKDSNKYYVKNDCLHICYM